VRLVLGFSALLLVSSAPRAAQAAERAFAVTWQAPDECPDATAIERYVDQVVGDAAVGPVTVRASGTAQRTADGRYAATLELDLGAAAPSVRTLDGRDCEAVSQAAALVIALAIRAQSAPPEPPPQPAPEPPPQPAPEPTRVSPTQTSRAQPFLSLGPIADFGSTPAATLGVALSGGLNWAGLRFEPGVAYFAPRQASIADRAALGARFSLATAGARLCVPLSQGGLWLAPCVGGGVDWLRGEGFGARAPRNGNAWSATVRGAALAGWDISSIISTHLELEGVLPLTRPEFQVEGAGFVYRRSSVAVRAAFAVDVHF